MHIQLIGCNGRYTHSTLSLFYLRRILAAKIVRAEISIQQFTINDNYFETLARITDQEADCSCFSVYICNSALLGRLLTDLSRLQPHTPLIIGGPEAAALATRLDLDNLTLVTGEAEGLPHSFFDDLSRKSLQKSYQCRERPLFSSPYDKEDFSRHLANRHIYYESSRGCPFSCSYCLSAQATGVRHLELDQVKEELDLILAHKPTIVRFIDRTFNALPARTVELWRHLLGLECETSFHFEIAPDLFTEEMFTLLAEAPAGKFQFEIGLQSSHAPTLAAVNRKMEVNRALATIRRLAALDTVHLHVDLILGLPFETEESYQQTFNDLFATGCHYMQMGLLKVLPDTPLARRQNDFALLAASQPPYELLQNNWFSHARLKHFYWFGECVEKFYNTHFFKPLFRYLRQRGENAFLFFMELTAACHKKGFFRQAATQELMSTLLARLARQRADRDTFLEILQLCWLYAGRRTLPSHLPFQDLKKNKAELYQDMPQNLPPYYSHSDRNHFFKQVEFGSFGAAAVNILFSYPGKEPRLICFMAAGKGRPMGQRRVVLVAEDKSSLIPPESRN